MGYLFCRFPHSFAFCKSVCNTISVTVRTDGTGHHYYAARGGNTNTENNIVYDKFLSIFFVKKEKKVKSSAAFHKSCPEFGGSVMEGV